MKTGVYNHPYRGKCWWVSFDTERGWLQLAVRPFNWRIGWEETSVAWRVFVGPFEIEEVML